MNRKGLIALMFLAPQPGLEPGTYGLTVRAICYFAMLINVVIIYINQQHI